VSKHLRKLYLELIIISIILLFSFLIFSKYDVLEKIVGLSSKYEKYEIDEIISTLIVFAICMAWFSFRRWRETLTTITILEKKNIEVVSSLEAIKILEGVIPICMHCKEIRDEDGAWNQLEKYISEHSEAKFSHGICGKCKEKHYPEAGD